MHPTRKRKFVARGTASSLYRAEIVALVIALLFFFVSVSPARAVDEVLFNGNNVFQLDEANQSTAAADTCVGSEPNNLNCSDQAPSWPADWDALLFPALTTAPGTIINPTPGGAPGAGTFTLPWGGFGAFSGIFKSTFVDTTSTILKQGSKNIDDISQWVVATQNSPPKDTIVAAAVATYVGPPGPYSGHELLYHAATRFSQNGSATEGIWLFQDTVQVCTGGPHAGKALCGADGVTLAQHKVGDAFLFITFGGSGFANIQVATWQGADGPSGSLGAAPGSIILCPSANDDACAVTNENSAIILGSPTGFQAPGTGFNVSGANFAGFPNGQVPRLQFQEGGVDLNTVLGGNAPCFSSVMFASVSSGSSPFNAALKAIILGNLNTCAISATKTCSAGTANVGSNTVTYPISGVVTNIGGGAVKNVSLSDMFGGNPLAFDATPTCTCGASCTSIGTDCTSVELIPGGTVNYSASITTSSNGGSDIVTATMSGSGGGSASAESNTATCSPISFPASVTVTKNCGNTDLPNGATLLAQGGQVVVEVGVSGTVTNGSSSLPLSSVTIQDCIGGTFAPPPPGSCPVVNPSTCSGTLKSVTTGPSSTLAPSGSSGWSDNYFPSAAPTCGPYNFDDQALVTASCTSQFCSCATVQNVANETCPLCPGPTCL